jgi:Ca-activated chloride channel family protein
MALDEAVTTIVGNDDRAVDPPVRARVLRARADEVRAEARALADRRQFDGAAAVLRRMIEAVQAEPWFVTNDGSPLAVAVEQLVDEAAAMERKPSQEAYNAFRKATTNMGFTYDAPPSSRCITSATLSVAGILPPARLQVVRGDLAGQLFPLTKPRTILGRTAGADIVIRDADVSRQHLMITGQHGRFLAQDMGSTNSSWLNGRVLARPEVLSPGDVIRIGGVELRYEHVQHER